VNWPTVNRPKDLGGLGVLDLEKFASALRLRWLWQEWKEPNKPWVGLGTLCSDKDKLLFAATTTIQIGSGAKTSFWHSAWIQGRRPKDIAPAVTTGDCCFAVCQSTRQSPICTRQRLCRVPHTAKSTRHSDVGKGVVCRVPFIGHTAKPLPCAKADPRQKKSRIPGK